MSLSYLSEEPKTELYVPSIDPSLFSLRYRVAHLPFGAKKGYQLSIKAGS